MRRILVASLLTALLPLSATATDWERVLFGNEINDLFFRDGNAYWGTTSGLVVMDMSDSTATLFRRDDRGLPSDSVNVVSVDASGNVWCGTDSDGIAVRTPQNRWEFLRTFDGLPDGRILSIEPGVGDEMIVGTANGVVTFSDLETRSVTTSCTVIDPCVDIFPTLTVQAILSFNDPSTGRDVVWYGTSNGVVVQDFGAAEEYRDLSTGFSDASIQTFIRFEDEVWAGTNDGAYRFDGGSDAWVVTPTEGGFTDFSVLVEFEGELWGASTGGQRVGRWDGAEWVRMGSNFPGDARPSALAVDEVGDLWCGTRGGLRRWSGTNWETPIALDGLVSARPPWSVAVRSDGEAWMGFKASLAGRYDGESWELVTESTSGGGFDRSATQDLLIESNGTVWFGHCCCSDPGCFVNRLIGDPSDPSDWTEFQISNVRAMAVDDRRHYFFGSAAEDPAVVGDGLYFWTDGIDPSTPGRFEAGAADNSLSSNTVAALAFDDLGRLWIGHRLDGVDIWDFGAEPANTGDDSWTHLDEDDAFDPLISNQVLAMVAEGPRVWIGTALGVAVYENGALIGEWAGGALGSPLVSAMAATSDGSVWAGTATGVVRFVPNAVGTFDIERTSFPDIANDQINGMAGRGDEIWIVSERGLTIGRPSAPDPGTPVPDERRGRAYPNPFHTGVHDGIRLTDMAETVDGRVIDSAGHTVARFEDVSPGEVVWNGRTGDDQTGVRAAPGLYAIVGRGPTTSITARVAIVD